MFNFDHLKFADHPRWDFVQMAQMKMSNDYGISVVQGEQTYGSADKGTYEVAVFDGDFKRILYNLPLKDENGKALKTSDVIGFVPKETVSAIMKQLQEGIDA
jgi:hypothetical protein